MIKAASSDRCGQLNLLVQLLLLWVNLSKILKLSLALKVQYNLILKSNARMAAIFIIYIILYLTF